MSVGVSSTQVGWVFSQYRVRRTKPSRKRMAQVLAKVPENLKKLTGTDTKIG